MAYFDNNGGQVGNGWGGYGYTSFNPGMANQTKIRNFLTAEEAAQLTKSGNKFSLAITPEQKLRAKCNHFNPDGSGDALINNPDGTVSCRICGYTFRPLEVGATTREQLMEYVSAVIDILQTAKFIYVDLDPNIAAEYFQLIPLLEKLPDFFEIAAKNFAKHEQFMPWMNGNRNMSTVQAFQILNSMIGGGGFGQPNPQVFNNGFNQNPNMYNNGFGYQNPNPAPGFGFGPQNPTNGFGYYGQNPQPGYTPQTSGFQTVYGQNPNPAQPQPGAPQPAPAPVGNGAGTADNATATTDGNTKTVSATFKA